MTEIKMPVELVDAVNDQEINFNMLSKMGLVYRLNKVLHPLGLALGYDPDVGDSNGAIVADDGEWEYSKEIEAKGQEKYNKFLELRSKMTIQEVIQYYKDQNV